VFLQELIEQHRVYCLVAHGVNLATFIAHYQGESEGSGLSIDTV
jgi:hypothetical protein